MIKVGKANIIRMRALANGNNGNTLHMPKVMTSSVLQNLCQREKYTVTTSQSAYAQ